MEIYRIVLRNQIRPHRAVTSLWRVYKVEIGWFSDIFSERGSVESVL